MTHDASPYFVLGVTQDEFTIEPVVLYDPAAGKKLALPADFAATDAWYWPSPDGMRLAWLGTETNALDFYNGKLERIRRVTLPCENEDVYEQYDIEATGLWSPDGQYFAMIHYYHDENTCNSSITIYTRDGDKWDAIPFPEPHDRGKQARVHFSKWSETGGTLNFVSQHARYGDPAQNFPTSFDNFLWMYTPPDKQTWQVRPLDPTEFDHLMDNTMPADDTTPRPEIPAEFNKLERTWAPDGRLVLLGGDDELLIYNPATGEHQVIIEDEGLYTRGHWLRPE